VIPPGATLGILGGGQLGRMTALAAAALGYRTAVLAERADDPAAQVATATVVGGYDDEAALARLAALADAVTLEFENVPAAGVAFLERLGKPVRPGSAALAVAQDRAAEKAFAVKVGGAVPAYRAVASAAELVAAVAAIGAPAVLKTRRLGYDGKGQATIRDPGEAAAAWAKIGGRPAIVEAFVDFACEISVIVARGADGALATYVPVENRHRDHILAETIAPAPIAPALAAEAEALAKRMAEGIGLVGLLAIELFVTRDGRLLVNEMAPRPHNSGHWTIDACLCSQFEQAVRCAMGLPLGDPTRHSDARMVNLIGDDVAAWPDLLARPGARLHLYGKAETRPGRKMGHVTELFPRRDR
jgi:5-(carboxyamino)imidazole ribonucleotide synthase